MSALGGKESEPASNHDELIKGAVSMAINHVNETKDFQHWRSEPTFLQKLFVLEVHIQRDSQDEIGKYKEKVAELEGVVSKYEGELENKDGMQYTDDDERNKFIFKDRPQKEIKIMTAKNNLRVYQGLVTEHCWQDLSIFYHYVYLIQLSEEGKPILIARIDPETQRWKNLCDYCVAGEGDDVLPKTFFLVDETTPATSIFSDQKDYFFKIFDKIDEVKDSRNRTYYEGKTSFLYTYCITWTHREKFRLISYNARRGFPYIWVGTNLAKIEILRYNIRQDEHRIRYLDGRINRLGESEERLRRELEKLKGNNKFFQWWLDILLEAEELNDHSACIEMARQHLRDINFSEPIVLEIASDVSNPYRKEVIQTRRDDICRAARISTTHFNRYLRERERLNHPMLADMQPTLRQERILFYSHLDTVNGYRLSTTNSDSTIYDLFILQVINRRITILAKLTRKETFDQRELPMSHTWKNLPIKRTALPVSPNIRKVLENYHSFYGKSALVGTDWQLDYSFTIARTESDEVGLLHGKTGYLPQLFIHRKRSQPPTITTPLVRDSAYKLLRIGMQNPMVMLNSILKVQRNDDTDLTTFKDTIWGIHHPGGPIMLQKKFDIDSAIRSLETKITQFEESKGRASTSDDFSAAALQKSMARWRWW